MQKGSGGGTRWPAIIKTNNYIHIQSWVNNYLSIIIIYIIYNNYYYKQTITHLEMGKITTINYIFRAIEKKYLELAVITLNLNTLPKVESANEINDNFSWMKLLLKHNIE